MALTDAPTQTEVANNSMGRTTLTMNSFQLRLQLTMVDIIFVKYDPFQYPFYDV